MTATRSEASWNVRPTHLALAILILAHLPMVTSHFAGMWQEPHYQFFPLLIIAVACLGYKRVQLCGPLEGPSAAAASAVVGTHGAIVFLAFLFCSPWVATSNLIALSLTTTWIVGGAPLTRRLFTTWLPLLLLVRPPLLLDKRLMATLQLLTSRWASVVLDAMHELHCHTGNVIRAGGRQYFVEEACSGINSLLTILSASALYLIWNRRSALISALLVMSAVWWVLVVNVLRVVAIVVLNTRYDIPVVDGWMHEALGLGLFAAALFLIWSSEQMLAVVLPDAWARAIAAPPTLLGPTRLGSPGLSWTAAVALAILPALVLAGHLGLAVATAPSESTVDIPAFDRSTLAEEVQGWHVTEYRKHVRDRSSLSGQFSDEWAIQNGGHIATLSLDYLFTYRHDLSICYRGQGWTVDEDNYFPVTSNGSRDEIRELVLSTPTGRHALVQYVHFDDRLEPLAFDFLSAGDRMTRRLFQLRQVLAGLELSSVPVERHIYQLQVVARSFERLAPEARAAFRAHLVASLGSIRTRWPNNVGTAR